MTLGTLIWIVLISTLFIIGNCKFIKFAKDPTEEDVNALHVITVLLDIIIIIFGLVFLTVWANTIKLW